MKMNKKITDPNDKRLGGLVYDNAIRIRSMFDNIEGDEVIVKIKGEKGLLTVFSHDRDSIVRFRIKVKYDLDFFGAYDTCEGKYYPFKKSSLNPLLYPHLLFSNMYKSLKPHKSFVHPGVLYRLVRGMPIVIPPEPTITNGYKTWYFTTTAAGEDREFNIDALALALDEEGAKNDK